MSESDRSTNLGIFIPGWNETFQHIVILKYSPNKSENHIWELLSHKANENVALQWHNTRCIVIYHLFTTPILILLPISAVKTSLFGSNTGHCSSGRWQLWEVAIVSETCVGGNKFSQYCYNSKTESRPENELWKPQSMQWATGYG